MQQNRVARLGGDLLPLLEPYGAVIASKRSDLDLADAGAVRRFVKDIKPQWIINPGAYTAVDKAESEAELAFASTPRRRMRWEKPL